MFTDMLMYYVEDFISQWLENCEASCSNWWNKEVHKDNENNKKLINAETLFLLIMLLQICHLNSKTNWML